MKRGQIIVEVMIAAAITIVALVAMARLSNQSVSNSGFSSRQSQATALATRVLEYVRNQKKTVGWDSFKNSYPAGNYCFNGTTLASSAQPCTVTGTEFASRVTLGYTVSTPPAPAVDVMTVYSEISWTETGQTHYSKQSAELVRF